MSAGEAVAPTGAVTLAPAANASLPLVLIAWLSLAFIHCVVALTGFPRLYRMIARWPTSRLRSAERDAVAVATCAAMKSARRYYFRYTWCLHSAAAAVALLRLRGVPAELVIGVRRIPFRGHAWVEVDGRVMMNGLRDLATNYSVITRC